MLYFCDDTPEYPGHYDSVIPAGKRLELRGTWGWAKNGDMTDMKTIVIHTRRPCTVKEAWRKLYKKYSDSLALYGHQPRDYWAEGIYSAQHISPNDTIVFQFGT